MYSLMHTILDKKAIKAIVYNEDSEMHSRTTYIFGLEILSNWIDT